MARRQLSNRQPPRVTRQHPPGARHYVVPEPRIGYGRVSTRDQNADSQRDVLEVAGCDEIYIDKGDREARRPSQVR